MNKEGVGVAVILTIALVMLFVAITTHMGAASC